MGELTGHLAAIGTAAFFGASSIVFTFAGRRIGAFTINRSRLLVASILATGIYGLTQGEPFPTSLADDAWLWLGISGILGLAAGDDLLFRAYVRVGPALTMLVFALAPAIAALLGWVLLGETLAPREMAGIALTLTGIAWVVASKREKRAHGGGSFRAGLAFALGGAVGQAVGLITAKIGLNAGASPQAANWVRLVAATGFLWALAALSGRTGRIVATWRADARAAGLTVLGAIFGPIAGVWLSLVAIELAPVGIASTLMSLTPLMLLPAAKVFFGEPVTLRALGGTSVALAGVAMLLL